MSPFIKKLDVLPPTVSYAKPEDSTWRRFIIRVVERLTGQPKLQRMYDEYTGNREDTDSFWEAAVRRLKLNVVYDSDRLAEIPKTGPLIVVANHPFGAIDGIALGYLISKVRTDFKVMAYSILDRAEPLRPYLIPIEFDGDSSALRRNVDAKRAALDHLKTGGAILIFPAGRVSTRERFFGPAYDSPWKTFLGTLVSRSNAAVVPIFFEGQCGFMFHFVSRFSDALRQALVLHEVSKRIGDSIFAHIGSPIGFADQSELQDRQAVMRILREHVYALSPDGDRAGATCAPSPDNAP